MIARWWSQTGSNRRPHACKARALPTELWPPRRLALTGFGSALAPGMVGPDRLELSTLRLSGVRSNHLSYGPSARLQAEWETGQPPGRRADVQSQERARTQNQYPLLLGTLRPADTSSPPVLEPDGLAIAPCRLKRRRARWKEKRRRRRPAPKFSISSNEPVDRETILEAHP